MWQKRLLHVLGALMLILWAALPVQSEAPKSLQKEACGGRWPVEQHKTLSTAPWLFEKLKKIYACRANFR